MTLSVIGWVYFFCFLLGLFYTVISLFLSHGHVGGDAHGELSHVHEDLARAVAHSHHPVDAGAHAHAPNESGQPDFPLFSPLTLALSVTVFGGVGMILNVLKMPVYVSLPASGAAGAAGWIGAF